MNTSFPDFVTLNFERPTRETLDTAYGAIEEALDNGAFAEALSRFDYERRAYGSWSALVELRFSQDTRDVDRLAAKAYLDKLHPHVTGLEINIKKRVLARRDSVAELVDLHVLALWEADVTTFDARIETMLVEEAGLVAEYTALLAAAEVPFRGETHNLSGLEPFQQNPDRETRHNAENARWAFFEANSAPLDRIYDDLVRLRTTMARTLGFASYVELGYRRMQRTDYTAQDVAKFRERILTRVTPLVQALYKQRQLAMGWESFKFWDEALTDPQGNPGPAGSYDVMIARAGEMFAQLDERGELAAFFEEMVEKKYLDLRNRNGKAGGGFCTSFPTIGTPFIFANFNGTHGDIGVFTHEMGHAFQYWKSREFSQIDMLWPTMDGAEIHSMGLEFLTWPKIDLLVEEGAGDRYRRLHLIESLCFLPYSACVDHFQHEIYDNPGLSPEERHATWQRLEKLYMPWRDWGDLTFPAKGGRWQAQHHIYGSPFYYIDYALALCVALQLWLIGQVDPSRAMDLYRGLCEAGGSKPFCALVRGAGLAVPFEDDALAEIIAEAEESLTM